MQPQPGAMRARAYHATPEQHALGMEGQYMAQIIEAQERMMNLVNAGVFVANRSTNPSKKKKRAPQRKRGTRDKSEGERGLIAR